MMKCDLPRRQRVWSTGAGCLLLRFGSTCGCAGARSSVCCRTGGWRSSSSRSRSSYCLTGCRWGRGGSITAGLSVAGCCHRLVCRGRGGRGESGGRFLLFLGPTSRGRHQLFWSSICRILPINCRKKEGKGLTTRPENNLQRLKFRLRKKKKSTVKYSS